MKLLGTARARKSAGGMAHLREGPLERRFGQRYNPQERRFQNTHTHTHTNPCRLPISRGTNVPLPPRRFVKADTLPEEMADTLTNAHGKARGRGVTDPPVKAFKDALNMLSMSVRDAQQQGSRVEDEDIREMFANLGITPGEAASEEAMDASRTWATVEDEDGVEEAMGGDAAEEITARLAGTQVDANSKEEKEKEEDADDESPEPGRGAPPAYAELSPHLGVLKKAAEEFRNKDAAFYLSNARMSMIAAHSAKRTRQTDLREFVWAEVVETE